jgi:hypothetical protein
MNTDVWQRTSPQDAVGASMPELGQPACEVCGRSPAQRFVVRRHQGLLLMMRMHQVKPTLCRDHATKILLKWTGRTLLEGWWGLISLFVANPATILLNLWNLAKARRMDEPNLSSPLATETVSEDGWWGASAS